MLLSTSIILPLDFLRKESFGDALGRRLVLCRRSVNALDSWQACFLVLGYYNGSPIGIFIDDGQAFAQEVSNRVFQFSAFVNGAEPYLLHERIREFDGCFHSPILLVRQLAVKL